MSDLICADKARALLALCQQQNIMIATAESCTGGLIIAALTDIEGSSATVDRGFITYSNQAKHQMLGIDMDLIDTYGAVSKQVAFAMAEGALAHSDANLSLAVTGIAGPGGGSAEKPVGLVHIASAYKHPSNKIDIRHMEARFGDIGRSNVRLKTVAAALDLGIALISASQ